MGYIEWLLPYTIQFELVLIAALIGTSLSRSFKVSRKRHNSLHRSYAITVAFAIILGVALCGTGLLDQYKVKYIPDPVAATWSQKVTSLREKFGSDVLSYEDCSRRYEPGSDILLKVSYAVNCASDQGFIAAGIQDTNDFTRYATMKSWFLARSAYKRKESDPSYGQDVEVIRVIGASISAGKFPSEMSYGAEGGLARSFRQYIRENHLTWEAFWAIEDKSVSIQIAFKELAQIGSVIWSRIIDKPGTFLPDAGGVVF
jgi:hypothetical protein